MSIKNDIRDQIKSAIRHFDFEDAISTAMESIDIEEMVSQKISQRIEGIDFEPMVAELIGDLIDEQLDDLDIENEVLGALQVEFEG